MLERDGCQWGGLDVTGLFGGVLARYARIVAEHPELPDADHARAQAFASAASLALLDIPASERAGDTTHLLYLVPPGAPAGCTRYITKPGMPYPYNMQHLMFGAMLDLLVARARGLTADNLDALAAEATADLPRLWTQWASDAVIDKATGVTFRRWPTGLAPDGKDRLEDASHAAVTIELLSRLAVDRAALPQLGVPDPSLPE